MNETYNVIYSPKALDDLREIYSYIAFTLKVPDTAKDQVNRIRKKIRSLDLMPLRYTLVDWEPWKSLEMHKLPIDNFIAYYTVNADSLIVTIIRIVYGGRDTDNIIKLENE